MQRTITTALVAAGMVAALLLGGAGDAQAQSSTPCSSRYKLAWELPLRASDVGQKLSNVLNRSEFSTVTKNSLSGISIARAPDGTVALQSDIERGKASKNHNNLFYLSSLGSRGVEAACMTVRLFMQSGFEWPTDGGTKMGWGLWGGDRTTYVGGGATPGNQTGWSVRNVNSQWGYRLYSYHLNRSQNGTHGEYSRDWSPRWGTSEWNAGRWHTVELEVVMNTPGRSDGYTQHWLNGKRVGAMTNLQFRRNTNWAIRGLMFHEMWQATSPKAQKMWYANFKFYTGNGGAVAASTPQSSGSGQSSGSNQSSGSASSGSSGSSSGSASSGSGGSFGAVAPQGTVNGRNLVVTWKPDSRAERYYVKVQTRSTKSAVFGKVAWPTQSCSASQCSLNLGNLPNGDYDWMVRPQNGSTAIASYSQMSISVR